MSLIRQAARLRCLVALVALVAGFITPLEASAASHRRHRRHHHAARRGRCVHHRRRKGKHHSRRACRAGARSANKGRGHSGTSTGTTSTTTSTTSTTGSPTWTSSFDGNWGVGTTNSFSETEGWWGFSGVPNEFIGTAGWSFQNRYFSFSSSPALSGQSFDATVDSGATTSGEAGQRSLIYQYPADPNTEPISDNQTAAYEGQDQWYHWHVYFPTSFSPEPNTSWNVFDEFHQFPNSVCCANITFFVVTDTEDGGTADPGGRFDVRMLGGGSPTNPIPDGTDMGDPTQAPSYNGVIKWYKGPNLQLGHWYDVLVHVAWDWESNLGAAQVWVDGNELVNYTGPTLFYYEHDGDSSSSPAGPGNDYLSSGYYRWGVRNGVTDTQVDSVYHDEYSRGPSQSSVGG